MSSYYGTLTSDKGQSTRAGHRYIRATAQTFAGSVSVRIQNGFVQLLTSEVSENCPSRVVWEGTLAQLLTGKLYCLADNPTHLQTVTKCKAKRDIG